MFRCLLSVILVLLFSPRAGAQQVVLTNKEGVRIEAAIVAVAPDWRKMTIRKDGNAFEIEPNKLSLDSQQEVKDWLAARGVTEPGHGVEDAAGGSAMAGDAGPTASHGAGIDLSSVRLDVKLVKRLENTEREDYLEVYRIETERHVYDIRVTSIGRETIPRPRIRYAVVWEESARFKDGRYSPVAEPVNLAVSGEKSLEELSFNREQSVTTDPVEIHALVLDTRVQRQDKLLGALARIELEDGTVIGEFASKEVENAGLSWEAVEGLGSEPGSRPAERDRPIRFELAKGEIQEGPLPWKEKAISIRAKVTPSTARPDGVIVAMGGEVLGLAVYVENREVIAVIRKEDNLVRVSRELPLGGFDLEVTLAEGRLSLALNGGQAVTAPAELFDRHTLGGVEVAEDVAPLAGPYPEDFPFAGEIEGLTVDIGA